MVNAVYILGVSGSGKSTVGAAVATYLGHPFLEGDDFHPAENIEKMSAGMPLSDADRWPWLEAIADSARRTALVDGGAVAACSGLRQSYRRLLLARTRVAVDEDLSKSRIRVHQVLLNCDRDLLLQRLQARPNHFMPATLLDSQLDTLEPPASDERILEVNGDQDISLLVEKIAAYIVGNSTDNNP